MNTKHIDREAIRQAIAEEAAHWDQTDTSDLMEQETEWLTLEWTPRDDRCERCGAKMELRQIDLHLSDGRVTLHRVGWYTCHTPGCGQAKLAPGMVALADQIETLVKQTSQVHEPLSVPHPQAIRESVTRYDVTEGARVEKSGPTQRISDFTVADLEALITQIVHKALAQEKEKTLSSVPEVLLATFGAWQDERSAEEIVEEIYASRTVSREHAL